MAPILPDPGIEPIDPGELIRPDEPMNDEPIGGVGANMGEPMISG